MGAILIAEDGGDFQHYCFRPSGRVARVAEYVAEDPADRTESWTGGLRVWTCGTTIDCK